MARGLVSPKPEYLSVSASVAAGDVSNTPELQARYIRRHAEILDAVQAAAVFQITFTDLDLSAVGDSVLGVELGQ
jgi:hypothetical protein